MNDTTAKHDSVIAAANEQLMRRRRELAERNAPARVGAVTLEVLETGASRAMARADGPGFLGAADRWRFDEQQLRARDLRMARERWLRKDSGIPRGVANSILDLAVDRMEAPCDESVRSLSDSKLLVVISGPPGTGKTWGACFALVQRHVDRDLLEAEYGYRPEIPWAGGLFVTAFEYADLARLGKREECRTYSKAPALVLDDLGREPQMGRAFVEELLIGRWGDDLPTIVTTNLTPDELGNRYDGRVIDRLQEPRADVIEVDKRLRHRRGDGNA